MGTAKLSTHRASRVPERLPIRQSKVSPHYFHKNKTSSHESSSPMSIENLKSFDPFAEAEDNQPDTKKGAQDYIHIRIQQRNGRIVNDTEMGEVIQLQGDQRKDVQEFLVDKKEGLELDAKTIKVHGF